VAAAAGYGVCYGVSGQFAGQENCFVEDRAWGKDAPGEVACLCDLLGAAGEDAPFDTGHQHGGSVMAGDGRRGRQGHLSWP
jgi:hypothetical protein